MGGSMGRMAMLAASVYESLWTLCLKPKKDYVQKTTQYQELGIIPEQSSHYLIRRLLRKWQ
jgi:hypothetical protein